jgi:hypothetical protein
MWTCGTEIKAGHLWIFQKCGQNMLHYELNYIFQVVAWVVGPCIVLQGDTSVLGDTDCTHSEPEDGGSMIF